MITLVGLRLDHRGISNILRSREVDDALGRLSDEVARTAAALVDDDVEIRQDSYTTDRAARAVVIAHPSGVALQARHGVLTRAAAQAGLEVKDR